MMVRKANGYVTNTGHFFQTKPEAEAYEAVNEYATALNTVLADAGLVGSLGSYVKDVIRYFVLSNGPAVIAYANHFKGATLEKPTVTDIRAPATGPVAFPGDDPIPADAERFDLEDTFEAELKDLEVIDDADIEDASPDPEAPSTDEDFSDLTPEQRASIMGGDPVDYTTLQTEQEAVGQNDAAGTSPGGDG